MIAITIIGVIGVISVAIFTQTLRTSSQTEDLSNLKQNGELAMNTLTEAIRNAEAIVCYGPPDNTYDPPDNTRKERIVIRTGDGKYVKFRFVDPSYTSGSITGNGYIARQSDLDPEGLADFCISGPAGQESPITNNNLSSGVSISNGRFTRISGNVSKDTISLIFNVNPTKSAGGSGASEIAVMQTTVQVR